MKRVLIVVSSFKPAMIADMHRARMLTFHLPDFGWEVEILSPDKSYQPPEIIEENSFLFFPHDIEVHYVPPWHHKLFQKLGIGTIGWRALWPLYKKGVYLIKNKRYDLVYFSTTNFILFCLGRLWYRKYGVPYVLDFHDPFYIESYDYVTSKNVIKWKASRFLSKYLERFAVRDASGIVSVSPKYLNDLINRYSYMKSSWLKEEYHKFIPFGAMEEDFNAILHAATNKNIQSKDKYLNVVYVGAGGSFMVKSFEAMCRGLFLLKCSEPVLVEKIRISLHGTQLGWREGDTKILKVVAENVGIGDIVQEFPARISYAKSLELVSEADGLMILGVDDAGYLPSKLISYALSCKPLLAAFHSSSPAHQIFNEYSKMGNLISFEDSLEYADSELLKVVRNFVLEMINGATADRSVFLKPLLAPAMSEAHAALFNNCVTYANSKEGTYK